MVLITRKEKEVISKEYPGIHIARTMRGDSKRGHYFMSEEPKALKALEELRTSMRGGDLVWN